MKGGEGKWKLLMYWIVFTNELNYSQEAGNIAGAMLRKPDANLLFFKKEIRKLHLLNQQNCEK